MADQTTPAEPAPTTHPCPGSCGRQVPHHLFACRACWMRLPYQMRQPISATYERDAAAHAAAMQAARGWYRTHAGVRS